jgi:hypothetical protein
MNKDEKKIPALLRKRRNGDRKWCRGHGSEAVTNR